MTLRSTGWGLVVCALAMFAAAAVEWRRLQLFQQGHYFSSKEPGMEHMKIVDMSVFWQIPQYLLVGISEVPPPYHSHTQKFLMFVPQGQGTGVMYM